MQRNLLRNYKSITHSLVFSVNELDQFEFSIATIYARSNPLSNFKNNSYVHKEFHRNTCAFARLLFTSLTPYLFTYHCSRFEKFGAKNIFHAKPRVSSRRSTSCGNTWLWKNYFDPQLSFMRVVSCLRFLPLLPFHDRENAKGKVLHRAISHWTERTEIWPARSRTMGYCLSIKVIFPIKSDVNRIFT